MAIPSKTEILKSEPVFQQLKRVGTKTTEVDVKISNELVRLLSDQLYQSPLKAIEELVVNSYDADAKVCKIFVPSASELSDPGGRHFIVVFDDGTGLTKSGMVDLWHIGRSNKRTEEIAKRAKRKQIGKFGIGKLATYTITKKLTYISKTDEGILSATLDFGQFRSDPSGGSQPVQIPLLKIADWSSFRSHKTIQALLKAADISPNDLNRPSWTIAVLEELKEKAHKIRVGNLKWVLSTAMPLKSEFALFLNGEAIESSKQNYEPAANFKLQEISPDRIKALNEKTGDDWRATAAGLISKSFPEGITGEVIVTVRTLPGKSDDLLRSYGFFIRVRGRLINEDEPFFGMTPLQHGTLNRFRADIEADDLDAIITAPREGVEVSDLRNKFELLLVEVFQEARQRYERFLALAAKKEETKKEHSRNFVIPALVEQPIASALGQESEFGADADKSWFYFDLPPADKVPEMIRRLYSEPRNYFTFQYVGLGSQGRLLKLDPSTSTFTLNSNHAFVAAHSDETRSKLLLEDMAIAEALLEAQLRLAHVSPPVIGEVLEERDKLLKAIALDHPYSVKFVANSLRDAAANEHDLELAVVAAARSLGFVAKHVSGSSEPDGVARYVSYPEETYLLTLEAKSSADVPSLSAIDFAGLDEHVKAHEANGCLLVAPAYPGSTQEDSAAAARARNLRISCWTIEQLARVVESAETRHITARRSHRHRT